MEHQQIFPTNLFIQDDFLTPQRLPAMKDEILSSYEKRKPNWQTGPDLDKTEPFKWFAKDISREVFKSIDIMEYQADTIEITGMWGNVLKPGETHQPHTHSNNFLSGVFYIDANNTSGITFQDPRPGANVILPRKKVDHIDNASLLHYKAKTNRIIIFPSWLVHWVPINRSTKDRISISFNIQVKGQLGERHEFQSAKY